MKGKNKISIEVNQGWGREGKEIISDVERDQRFMASRCRGERGTCERVTKKSGDLDMQQNWQGGRKKKLIEKGQRKGNTCTQSGEKSITGQSNKPQKKKQKGGERPSGVTIKRLYQTNQKR